MQNSQNKIVITIGVIMFVAGIFILSSNYLNQKVDNAYSYMNNLLLTENETLKNEDFEEDLEEVVTTMDDTTSSIIKEEKNEYVDQYSNYYVGNIEIPKISLNKGFLEIDSKYNTVAHNVEVVKGSTYPDVALGNFILAAHSGNSYLAYFKDLYKLNIGDEAYINYKNYRYKYEIVKIYEQEKTGKVAIYRDTNKTCLTLITCTKDSKTKQTIYILELVDIFKK